jgi:membrane protease subunit HflC
MRAAREGFAAQYRSEGNERASKIQTEAKLEESRILAEARQESLKIRGEGAAEAKRIENESIQLNPELYWRLRSAEIAESALRGALIVLPADHPLGQIFELVGPTMTAPSPTPAEGGE